MIADLEVAANDGTYVDALARIIPSFEFYVQYSENYDRAQLKLAKHKKSRAFRVRLVALVGWLVVFFWGEGGLWVDGCLSFLH